MENLLPNNQFLSLKAKREIELIEQETKPQKEVKLSIAGPPVLEVESPAATAESFPGRVVARSRDIYLNQ